MCVLQTRSSGNTSRLISKLTLLYTYSSCGLTVPYSACACKDGTYKCALSDSCLLPVCLFKNWDALIGTSCTEATAEILKEYPGLKVICTTEKPAVTDDDFDTNRIYVVVDADQVVVGAPTIG